MAIQKSITHNKREYNQAYIRIESIRIDNGKLVNGTKKYGVELQYIVYADKEKDVELYRQHRGYRYRPDKDESLTEEQSSFAGLYSLLKEELKDCIDV